MRLVELLQLENAFMAQLTGALFYSVKSNQTQAQPLKCCCFFTARCDFVLASPWRSTSVPRLFSVSSAWDLRLSGRISQPTYLREERLIQGQISVRAWDKVINFGACFPCGSCVAFACCVCLFPVFIPMVNLGKEGNSLFLVSANSYDLLEGLREASGVLFPSSLASFEALMSRAGLIVPDSFAKCPIWGFRPGQPSWSCRRRTVAFLWPCQSLGKTDWLLLEEKQDTWGSIYSFIISIRCGFPGFPPFPFSTTLSTVSAVGLLLCKSKI